MSRRIILKKPVVSSGIGSSQSITGVQPRKQIEIVCRAISRRFHPDKIVLFGSHAHGKPRPESDVDLLVVMPFEGSPFRQAAVILDHVVRAVGVLPLDLLVRTAEQVQERIQMGDTFMRDVIERGRVMYEADHS
ncbi:MAG TPA: nucleotidyltransferase domain-containing protein [Blastocatellia bacterium]|nr:nucleotidyltransferase domain-containing protein [Blastocatellia bacterium]